MASLVGRVLGSGRYEIIELYGKGAFAEVYRGRQLNLNRDVAVKVLNEDSSRDDSLVKRFHNEAAAVARFDHPNIIKIFDHGEEEHIHYYVMNFLPRTLRSLFHPNRPLPLEIVLQVASQLAAALAYAQTIVNNFVHRDIKPENVMLDQSHNAVLSDFGLVRGDEISRLTVGDNVIGTPTYMSPEQIRGKTLDPRSDLYALGVLLYECATGAPPFKGDLMAVCHQHVSEPPVAPRSLNPDLSPEVDALILKLLEKAPEKRYQSAAEVLAALADLPGDLLGKHGNIYSLPTMPVTRKPQTSSTPPQGSTPPSRSSLPTSPAKPRTGNKLFPVYVFVGISALALSVALFNYFRQPGAQPRSAQAQLESPRSTPTSTVPPLAPALGSINIESTPPGAAIYWNGIQQKHVTPARFDSLKPSRYAVRLTLPGYEAWNGFVTIQQDCTASVQATLAPSPSPATPAVTKVSISIVTRPPGEIILDGKSLGAPLSGARTALVTPGRHDLQIRLESYPTVKRDLWVKEGSDQSFVIDLFGEISVQAFDEIGDPLFGAVFLDNVQTSWKSDGSRHKLIAGEYRVTVKSFGYEMIESPKKIIVTGGDYRPIVVQMRKE